MNGGFGDGIEKLKLIKPHDLEGIAICPHCGSEEFDKAPFRCSSCELLFWISGIKFNGANSYRVIFASVERMISEEDWTWRMRLRECGAERWDTWDDKARNLRRDTRSIGDIKALITKKWKAHKVAEALLKS